MILYWVFLATYACAVYVGWPMDEQLPNVARVDESYSFTLANSTYKSSAGGTISYSVENLPSWLSFDDSSRTFSGTPSSDAASSFEITLIGTDSADSSSYSANYSMIVSNSSGLSLSSSDVMFTTIAQYGMTNGLDGLVVKQGEDISINFTKSVFKSNSGATRPIIAYYGRSGDRTSLPNWMSFDEDTLTFKGTVPHVTSEIAPSMEYTFAFIGSDYVGYTGAEGTFKLIVGAHQLSTSLNESIKINGSYGSDFDYTVPILSAVYLDGSLIEKSNISSVYTEDLPDYVSFDSTDYALTGTFPNASSFQNFTVVVTDSYGDSVSIPYSFDSIDSVFTISQLSDVNATRGEYFQHQLLRSDFTDFNDTTIDVTFANDSSWLTYHSSNLTMNGETPEDLDSVKVTVKASSEFGDGSLSFEIIGIDPGYSSSSSSTSSSTSSSSTTSVATSGSATSTVANTNKNSSSNNHKLILGLAIGLPLFALVLAILLLLFCCYRKKHTNKDEETQSITDVEPELTGPGFGKIDSHDDHNERAVQLGALNALKLDHDNSSTSSSLTHVDSNGEDAFYDASEKPMVSWRANETSDSSAMKKFLLSQKHASEMSVDTVNTDQLFSVRLVDDNLSNRNSSQSFGTKTAYVSNLPISNDNSSANIQRLDSDGNIVEFSTATSSPTKGAGAKSSPSLNNISEEDTSNSTYYTQESSSYNLLNKFLGSNQISEESSVDARTANSLHDEFQPTTNAENEVKWKESEDAFVHSPDAESFLLDPEIRTRDGVYPSKNKEATLSRGSVYSELSFSNMVGDDGKRGIKAKLVEFTRKASLRDSSHQQYVDHSANTAQILDDSD